MTETEEAKVWWAYPGSAWVKQIDIKPYFADVVMEGDRLQDMADMSDALRSYLPCPPESIPDELRWYQRVVTDKDRNLPDAFQGYAGTPVVSEAMRDVLSEFDLGSSQFFECPLYELKATGNRDSNEADRSKQDPRRWFLMHISETKQTLEIDRSSGIHESRMHQGIFYVRQDENPVVAIKRDIATAGSPIWRDPSLPGVFIFNDSVKRAIMAKGLRTPAFKFEPCILV